MLGDLNAEQRREFNRALLFNRRGVEISNETLQSLSASLDQMQMSLGEYVQSARLALASNEQLSESDLAAWESVLVRVDANWRNQWKPGLNSLFETRALSDDEAKSLIQIQSYIDELDLAAVLDNSVARRAERNAWFRLVERGQDEPNEMLRANSAGVVGSLALHKQPKGYRGQVVTIRGKARLGYRVTAKDNILDIKEYSVIWIKPRGGPNNLMAAYCLNTPDLPPLKHKDKDEGVTELDHDVTITGFFFKKWAYRTRNREIRTAPQILANSPQVDAAPAWQIASPPASSSVLTIVFVVAAIAGVIVAVLFFYLNQWPSRIVKHSEETQDAVAQIDPSQVSPGVAFELKRMEQETDL